MNNRPATICRRIGLLELPPSLYHIIGSIYHTIKIDFCSIFINKLKLAAQIAPDII